MMGTQTTCLKTATVRAGFTLIELLAVLVIVAILTMIAVPAYSAYVTRSHVRAAQADLVALSLNMENYYQQQLSYPAATATTAATAALFAGWYPAEGGLFSYTIQSSDADAYALRASGSGARVNGYVITLTDDNVRTLVRPDGTSSSW